MKQNLWRRMLPMLVMLTAVLCINAAAADMSGSCGETVTWSYDAAAATLTISGSGRMDDYYSITPEGATEWEPCSPGMRCGVRSAPQWWKRA